LEDLFLPKKLLLPANRNVRKSTEMPGFTQWESKDNNKIAVEKLVLIGDIYVSLSITYRLNKECGTKFESSGLTEMSYLKQYI
jgi:hypothetical protein